jgi:hypothetical protein
MRRGVREQFNVREIGDDLRPVAALHTEEAGGRDAFGELIEHVGALVLGQVDQRDVVARRRLILGRVDRRAHNHRPSGARAEGIRHVLGVEHRQPHRTAP